MKQPIDSNKIILLTLMIAVIAVVFLTTITNDAIKTNKDFFSEEDFDDNKNYSIGHLFQRNEELDKDGMNCYSLKITVPYSLKSLALMLPPVDCEFEFDINGETLYKRTTEDAKIYGRPVIINYPPKGTILHLNAYLPDPDDGYIKQITLPLKNNYVGLGTVESLYSYQDSFIYIDFILIFICLISFIYQLMTYATQRSNSVTITFCLLSLSIVVSVLLANTRLINYFGINIPTIFALKLALVSYLTRYLCLFASCRYYVSKDSSKFSHKEFVIRFVITSAIAILIPVSYFYYLRSLFFFMTLACTINVIIVTIYYRIKHNNTALTPVIISLVLPLIASILDSIKIFSIYTAFIIPPTCFAVFVLIQDIIRIYSRKKIDNNIIYLTEILNNALEEMQNNKSTYISTHIKPDYLYETLESIKSNIDVDQEKVDKLIQSLSKYLRATLDFSGDKQMHELSEELDLCQAYINLAAEQNPKISFNFPSPEDVPYVFIPKYSILALVENSVLHGFHGTLRPCVTVQVIDDNEYVRISVSDNGCGMTDNEINEYLYTPKNVNVVGLYHINSMLINAFNTRVDIKSNSYKKTTVSFVIPKALENKEEAECEK